MLQQRERMGVIVKFPTAEKIIADTDGMYVDEALRKLYQQEVKLRKMGEVGQADLIKEQICDIQYSIRTGLENIAFYFDEDDVE